MASENYTVGQNVKLDDYGVIRTYKIWKIQNDGQRCLQSPGVICFTASIEWLSNNEIK